METITNNNYYNINYCDCTRDYNFHFALMIQINLSFGDLCVPKCYVKMLLNSFGIY